jgi:hypothetical protein
MFAVVFTCTWLFSLMTPMAFSSKCQPSQLVALPNNINPLPAYKLYDITERTATLCQLACLREDTCLTVAYNSQAQLCSLFATGTTLNNVTGLQVHTLESKQVNKNCMCVCTCVCELMRAWVCGCVCASVYVYTCVLKVRKLSILKVLPAALN